MMEKEKLEIKIDVADVANNFLLRLKEITECLTHIYNSINQSVIDIYKPLPTDGFPLKISDNKPNYTIEEQTQITLNWVLTKAFEDFINGLTKSLKSTFIYLNLLALSRSQIITNKKKEVIEKEIEKIYKRSEDMNFPGFIEEIEKHLNTRIESSSEIISINDVRNCLVHRHGVVSEKDVQKSKTNDLRLSWFSLKFYTQKGGLENEITYKYRKEKIIVDNLTYKIVKNEKIFQLGDKITIDINEFNGVSYTCATFVLALAKLMPENNVQT